MIENISEFYHGHKKRKDSLRKDRRGYVVN